MILAFSILTIILIGLIIWGSSEYQHWAEWVGGIGLVIVVVGGWLIYGIGYTQKTEIEYVVPSEILIGKHIAVISVDTASVEFKGYQIEGIDSNTKFYWVHEYNMYGFDMCGKLKFKIFQKNKK